LKLRELRKFRRRIQDNEEENAHQKQQFRKWKLDYLEIYKIQVDSWSNCKYSLYSFMETNLTVHDVKEHIYSYVT